MGRPAVRINRNKPKRRFRKIQPGETVLVGRTRDKLEYLQRCATRARLAMRGHNRPVALAWIAKIRETAKQVTNRTDCSDRVDNFQKMMACIQEGTGGR